MARVETAEDPQYQEYLQAELQQAREEIRALRFLLEDAGWPVFRALCDRYVAASTQRILAPVSTPEEVAAHNNLVGVISGLKLAYKLPEDLIKHYDELQDQLRAVRADKGGEGLA